MDEDQPEIVRIKLDGTQRLQPGPATKAFQIKIDDNKTMIVYNRVNSYILDAVLKAVFSDAH